MLGAFRAPAGRSIPTALDLAVRFSSFAILGFGPWWLAAEIFYG